MRKPIQSLTASVLIFTLILIQGCATSKPVEIIAKKEERLPLNLTDPAAVDLDNVEWITVTPDNASTVFSVLEKEHIDPVLLGLTDTQYKNLSINNAKIRAYISLLKQTLKAYRDYYENLTGP